MQLPIDEHILESLAVDLTLTPSIIAYNIDKPHDKVNQRLSELVEMGLVEQAKSDYYDITDDGVMFLLWGREPMNFGQTSM